MNLMECFNEIFLLMVFDSLFVFTDYVTSVEIRYDYGWYFMQTFRAVLLLDMAFALIQMAQKLIKSSMLYCIKYGRMLQYHGRQKPEVPTLTDEYNIDKLRNFLN